MAGAKTNTSSDPDEAISFYKAQSLHFDYDEIDPSIPEMFRFPNYDSRDVSDYSHFTDLFQRPESAPKIIVHFQHLLAKIEELKVANIKEKEARRRAEDQLEDLKRT